jgi:putative hemolysin
VKEGLLVTVLVLGTCVSFLLSGMEAGLFTVRRFRIRFLARKGDGRAIRLQRYLEDPSNFFWTILVGNTLAAWVVIAGVALELEERLEGQPLATVLIIVGVLFVFYIFADFLPKLLFRQWPNRLCLLGVVPFRGLHALLSPLVFVAEQVSRLVFRWKSGHAFSRQVLGSRAELRYAIEESSSSLSSEERAMVNRILDLQRWRVRDVMTPMDDAATLDASGTLGDLLKLVRQRDVSFVPLWRKTESGRRILGVVSLPNILFGGELDRNQSLEALVQPALFINEGTRLDDALRMMQRNRQRLGIVLNRQRTEVGVITLNDILRAMFGEVRI